MNNNTSEALLTDRMNMQLRVQMLQKEMKEEADEITREPDADRGYKLSSSTD